MNKWIIAITIGCSVFLLSCAAAINSRNPLAADKNYSESPASQWQDALVSGNGEMGIMVMGDPKNERIILNHEFLYEFLGTEEVEPLDCSDIVDDMKQLCLAQKYKEADELFKRTLKERGYSGMFITDPYHPAAALKIEQDFVGDVSDYRRTTDYTTGELKVQWKANNVPYERASFVSRPDNVIATRISGGAEVNVLINLEHQLKNAIIDRGTWSKFIENNLKVLHPDRVDELNTPLVYPAEREISEGWITFRVQYQIYDRGYEVISQVRSHGGTMKKKKGKLIVEHADSVEVLTRVMFIEPYSASEIPAARKEIERLGSYNELLSKHAAVHGEIYNRVRLALDKSGFSDGSNEELIERQSRSEVINPFLLEKMFNMGRYGLLCSSGNNPPNLCGLWTGEWRPMWSGDFTTDLNLNLQISAAAIGNMPEATEAYMRMIERIAPDWEVNAKHLFNCRGYCAGTRTSGRRNLHNHIGKWGLQAWTAGAAWLLNPCYEYVQCTGDQEFLQKRLLPLMDKTALFYEDFLDTFDTTGHYLIAPSWSPENQPSNQAVSAVANATMDIAVIRELLGNMIVEYQKRKLQPERVAKWKRMLEKLPPYLINEDGALQEWARADIKDNYNHRHSSHLYGAWPGFDIDPDRTPEIYRAAVKAAQLRGPGMGSAHGYVLLGLQGARLKQSDFVYDKLLTILRDGYLYRSLATSHNPQREIFNCDALHSIPAILMEMLVYSRPGVIELLPAYSEKLPDGRIDGIVCRTQAVVDSLKWDWTGKHIEAVITSGKEQRITIQLRRGMKAATVDGKPVHIEGPGDRIQVSFSKGQSHRIVFQW